MDAKTLPLQKLFDHELPSPAADIRIIILKHEFSGYADVHVGRRSFSIKALTIEQAIRALDELADVKNANQGWTYADCGAAEMARDSLNMVVDLEAGAGA